MTPVAKRRAGWAVVWIGAIALMAALGADLFSAGTRSGYFGWKQAVGTIAGLVLIATGIALIIGGRPRAGRAVIRLDRREIARLLAIIVILAAAVFVGFYRLDVSAWLNDELTYRAAGRGYVDGRFEINPEHPYVAKYLLGISQTVAGDSGELSVRLPAALAGLAIGGILFLFASRTAGLLAGVVTFATWSLIPHAWRGDSDAPTRIERFGLLDPFMGVFIAAALFAGWRWFTSSRWRWAIAAGSLAGLAAASKATGILVVPALVALLFLRPSKRAAAQACALLAACAVTALATYAPILDHADDRIRTMLDYHAAREGHPILLGGKTYLDPPWWAAARWQWENVGALGTSILLTLALVAPAVLNRRLVTYLAVAVVIPFAYFTFGSDFVLGHYYYAWLVPATLLAGLSLTAILRRPGWFRIGGIAAAVALLFVAADLIVDTSRLRANRYAVAADALRDRGLEGGRIVVVGHSRVLAAYLPTAVILRAPEEPVDAVLVSPESAQRVREIPGPYTDFLGDAEAAASFLDAHASDYERINADGLELHVRASHEPTQTGP